MVLLVATLAACASPIEIRSSADPTFDFSTLKTYSWMPRKKSGDPRLDGERMEKQVEQTVDEQLQRKGFKRVESGGDFLVGFRNVLAHRRTEEQAHEEYTSIWDDQFSPQVLSGDQTYEREYTEGSLVIDIIEPKENYLIWRGWAETEINLNKMGDENSRTRLGEAIHRLLARFPPKRGSTSDRAS